jgi:YtcA-like protein
MKQMWEEERRWMRFSRKIVISVAAVCTLCGMAGCGRAPSFNIMGSFFPAWLLCIITGVVLTAIGHWILVRNKLEKQVRWPLLVYPCFAALVALTLWLVFFS